MATTDNETHNTPLTGQVAIVTGGGRGIGREIARTFARAGAAVAVCARTAHEITETAVMIERTGGRVIAVQADVTDRNAVEHLVANAEKELGPVDVLVNNAGAVPDGVDLTQPSWEEDPEEWWRAVEINLRGPYLCAKTVLPGMVARGRGRIVNVATVGVLRASRGVAYSSAKTALVRWTEGLAAEAIRYGIVAVSMEPGFVRTAMAEKLAAQGALGMQRGLRDGQDTPAELAARLALDLASFPGVEPLAGRFFSAGDNVALKVRLAQEITDNDLYRLRMEAHPAQPIVPWSNGTPFALDRR